MIPEAGALDLERLSAAGSGKGVLSSTRDQPFGLECRAGSASSLASESSTSPPEVWACVWVWG